MNTKNLMIGAVSAFCGAVVTMLLLAPLIHSAPAEAGTYYQIPTEPETSLTCAEPQDEEPSTALDPYELELLSRTIWGEAEGVTDRTEQAAVAWCVLNRVDATGKSIEEVIKAPKQFQGYYRVKGEVPEHFRYLAADVMNRWNAEKRGTVDVGRVLPADYLYFVGDGVRNYFTQEYRTGEYWDWSLPTPYTY